MGPETIEQAHCYGSRRNDVSCSVRADCLSWPPLWIKRRVEEDEDQDEGEDENRDKDQDEGGAFLGFGQRQQLCLTAPPSSR